MSGELPAHTCHARRCERRVPPRLFMCITHWNMVPDDLRRTLKRAYRPGQETDKRPSEAYLRAAAEAIQAVALKEQGRFSGDFADAPAQRR